MTNRLALTPALLRKAEAHLRNSDRVIRSLISVHGRCSLSAISSEPFHTLAASIISQQLSAKAASTIEARVAQLSPSPFQPAALRMVAAEKLRAAGLSARKATYIHELAQRVTDGRLCFEALSRADNEFVIERLTELPGIGRWTAEMFLIFGLKRPDVLALDDAGLQRAVRLLYGESCSLEHVGQVWRPYSSVASWYLWRHLDT